MKKGFTLREHERSKSGGRDEGFTLIELMVVIGIIGLISTTVLVSLQGARAKARDAQRIQEFSQVQKALELYYGDKEKYPAGYDGGQCFGDNPNLASDLASYLAPLPQEPVSGRMCYAYFSDSEGSGYKIMADLEKNPDLEMNDCGIYSDIYELCDPQRKFASAEFGGDWFYGGGGGGGFLGGYALKFDGTKSYVDSGQGLSEPFEGTEYTLEAWVKISESQSAFEPESQLMTWDADGFGFGIGGKKPAAYHAYTQPNWDGYNWLRVISPAEISLNEWHFLVSTYDGSTVWLYVDGAPKASSNCGGSCSFYMSSPAYALFGAFSNWSDIPGEANFPMGNFKGLVDEVKVYKKAMDGLTIEKHFNGEYGTEDWPLLGSLVSHWKFDEGEGGVAGDEKGANPGVLKPVGSLPVWELQQ